MITNETLNIVDSKIAKEEEKKVQKRNKNKIATI